MPFEVMRWRLAERFHWTLSEIDAMTLADMHELMQIDDGYKRAKTPKAVDDG